MLTSSELQKLKGMRLIFTVTTGRSGTAYLTTLFQYLPGVAAYHEPRPEFVEILRDVQGNKELAKEFLLTRKLPVIAAEKKNIYVETSHLFCKGFLEPLLEIGITPDLIIHTRPHRKVALSMLKLNTIPARTEKGLLFYLSPDDPGVLPIRDWQTLNDYQLCYWYCLEIERRAKEYEQLYVRMGKKVVKTTLENVRTPEGFQQMLGELQLRRPNLWNRFRQWRNARFRVNEALFKKNAITVPVPENLDDLEMEVAGRVQA